MELHQVSNHCYAVINEKNRVCDANSGLINGGGGLRIAIYADFPAALEAVNTAASVFAAPEDTNK
jgi:cyclase